MSKNPIARLRQDLEDKASTRRAETYEMINIRPGSKIAAMIELLAELRGVPVSSMLTDDLSERLAQHAASDLGNASIVLDAATAYIREYGEPSQDSAFGRLVARNVLTVETDNPLIRNMPKLTFAKSPKKTMGLATHSDDA